MDLAVAYWRPLTTPPTLPVLLEERTRWDKSSCSFGVVIVTSVSTLCSLPSIRSSDDDSDEKLLLLIFDETFPSVAGPPNSSPEEDRLGVATKSKGRPGTYRILSICHRLYLVG